MTTTSILFITRAYGENAGGMERLSYEFITAAKQNPDFTVQVIANKTRSGNSLLHTRVRSVVFALFVLPRALRHANQVDVIHIGDPVLSLAGWVLKKVYRKPVVVTVHGLDVTYANPLYQWYLQLFFHTFDHYLPISTYAKNMLGQLGITKNVTVLTPGITDRLYKPASSRAKLAELLSVPEDAVEKMAILLTAGRLVERKGHAWFIREVLPSLPENVLYVIAGTGSSAAEISAAIEDAKQSDRVKLLGRVSTEDLQVLYNTADVFVQPNIAVAGDAEGFGLVLLEAALCGRPVIASNMEGIVDAITHTKNGILVEPQNSTQWITAITNALEKSTALPDARAFTLEHFSWSRIMQQYTAIIRRLL